MPGVGPAGARTSRDAAAVTARSSGAGCRTGSREPQPVRPPASPGIGQQQQQQPQGGEESGAWAARGEGAIHASIGWIAASASMTMREITGHSTTARPWRFMVRRAGPAR
jgi:hypothetical protein